MCHCVSWSLRLKEVVHLWYVLKRMLGTMFAPKKEDMEQDAGICRSWCAGKLWSNHGPWNQCCIYIYTTSYLETPKKTVHLEALDIDGALKLIQILRTNGVMVRQTVFVYCKMWSIHGCQSNNIFWSSQQCQLVTNYLRFGDHLRHYRQGQMYFSAPGSAALTAPFKCNNELWRFHKREELARAMRC